jgi:Transglycosylase associated protein.
MGIIVSILVGALAGYIAGLLMKGKGFGFLYNLLIGIVGGFVGGLIFDLLGITTTSILGNIICAVVGAVALLFIISLFKKK